MTIYNGTITNFATAPQSEIDIGGGCLALSRGVR